MPESDNNDDDDNTDRLFELLEGLAAKPTAAPQSPSLAPIIAAQPRDQACDPSVCATMGDRLCGEGGQDCVTLSEYPCMVCVPRVEIEAPAGPRLLLDQSAPAPAVQSSVPAVREEPPQNLALQPEQSRCGNGVVEVGEACDFGAQNSDAPGAVCRTNCQIARCGDGIADPPSEQCDNGTLNSNMPFAACNLQCRTYGQVAAATTESNTLFLGLPRNAAPQTMQQAQQLPQYAQPLQANVVVWQQPAMPQHAPVGATGPGSLAVMAAGAAGGIGWVRRRRRS